MGEFGVDSRQIDTLVLGCTHYPFAKPVIQRIVGPDVRLIDNGQPVAKRVAQVLHDKGLLVTDALEPKLHLLATGETRNLQSAAVAWLNLSAPVSVV
jgi:glutamate racemase